MLNKALLLNNSNSNLDGKYILLFTPEYYVAGRGDSYFGFSGYKGSCVPNTIVYNDKSFRISSIFSYYSFDSLAWTEFSLVYNATSMDNTLPKNKVVITNLDTKKIIELPYNHTLNYLTYNNSLYDLGLSNNTSSYIKIEFF